MSEKKIQKGREARDKFLSFSLFGISIYNTFNNGYAQMLQSKYSMYKRLFLKEDTVAIPLNREPKTPGKLDLLTKERFESAFDANLEDVRIHTGEYATEVTRRADAEAVTLGSDIFFGQGKFNLESEEGLILLAHELQHVVQYKSGKRMQYREDVASLEAEADRVEGAFKQSGIHGMGRGSLDQSGDATTDRQAGLSESDFGGGDFGNSGTIDDFTSSDRETIYRMHLGDKVFDVTRKEREQILERAVEKLDEKVYQEYSILSDEAREEYLLGFMQFIHNY